MSRSPFPGMDPYLEAPSVWPDLHDTLMNIFREQLTPSLAPTYYADLHPQIIIEYIEAPLTASAVIMPDVAVLQPPAYGGAAVAERVITPAPLQLRALLELPTRLITLKIRERATDRLVTVIELLSPVNKRPGPKREAYLKKRATYLAENLHFLEIDLLRQHPRMPLADPLPPCDYLVILHNMYRHNLCDVWPLSVRDPLPILPVPLLRPDPDVPLDVAQALRTAYERARYDLRVDYTKPPTPPLSPDDAVWAQDILQNVSRA